MQPDFRGSDDRLVRDIENIDSTSGELQDRASTLR